MNNTKYAIREMLMDDTEITKFLLQGKENTYENVKGLFGTQIFDYFGSLADTTNTSAYIRFDVAENELHNYPIKGDINCVITVSVHKDLLHTTANINNLDMLASKIVEDVKNVFGVRNIKNLFGRCEDNKYLQERMIRFRLEE